MKADEIKSTEAKGISPVEHTIAYDDITAIVNPKNPVSNLSFDQLRRIYDGNITNWKEVGGEDKPITVISRDSSSGTYEYFKEAVLKGSEYTPKALTQGTTGGIIGEVSLNPNAIGYVGYGYLDESESVKALNLDKGNSSVSPLLRI
jgi:phosphate transport system substrate-binding protein